jgi:hypothetical protein
MATDHADSTRLTSPVWKLTPMIVRIQLDASGLAAEQLVARGG